MNPEAATGGSYPAVVNELAARLQTAPEKSVRGATDAKIFLRGKFQQRLSLLAGVASGFSL